MLTPSPEHPTLRECQEWAAMQDEDAIYMWGIREDGTSSREIAILRLTLHCLGDAPPEIVGFGSSAGFDEAYCERHPDVQLCQAR
jgi:hypothetical protein